MVGSPLPARLGSVIVEIRGLTKVYEEKQRVIAVDGIDLSVEQGEIFGLLGPNGAGKTTTISIATTRALPTSGQVTIAGVDVVAKPATARRSVPPRWSGCVEQASNGTVRRGVRRQASATTRVLAEHPTSIGQQRREGSAAALLPGAGKETAG